MPKQFANPSLNPSTRLPNRGCFACYAVSHVILCHVLCCVTCCVLCCVTEANCPKIIAELRLLLLLSIYCINVATLYCLHLPEQIIKYFPRGMCVAESCPLVTAEGGLFVIFRLFKYNFVIC